MYELEKLLRSIFLWGVIIYLKGLPALIVQFGHLLLDPTGSVRDSYVNDVLQEDGKVLHKEKDNRYTHWASLMVCPIAVQ